MLPIYAYPVIRQASSGAWLAGRTIGYSNGAEFEDLLDAPDHLRAATFPTEAEAMAAARAFAAGIHEENRARRDEEEFGENDQ